MAGAVTPELVAAVGNAGALGSVAAGYLAPGDFRAFLRRVRALTSAPFAVNLFVPSRFSVDEKVVAPMRDFLAKLAAREGFPPPPDISRLPDLFGEQVEVALEERVAVCSFTFGVLESDIMEKFRARGARLFGTATGVEEAKLLALAGCDALVAQGIEAGGHRGSFLDPESPPCEKLASLVADIRAEVEVPVVAAGAMGDAKAVKEMLGLGAVAVQIGTSFLTCTENRIAPVWKERLVAGDSTVVTNVVTGRYARMIRSRLVEELEMSGLKIPPYPVQHYLTQSIRKAASEKGDMEWMAMFSGENQSPRREISVAALLNHLGG